MKYFIYSYKQPDICNLIVTLLNKNNHEGKIYSSMDKMISDLKIIHRMPDVIIMDYQSFNHEIFNMEEYFFNEDRAIPYIFYNDPCPTSYCLSNHWLYQTIRFNKLRKRETAYDYLILYTDLEDIITSPDYSPYISLICKPKPLPENLIFTEHDYHNENELLDFKNRSGIPENLYKLLIILYKNKAHYLSLNDIIRLYAEEYKNITEASLKVMISNLKKNMIKDQKFNYMIVREEGNYRLIKTIK